MKALIVGSSGMVGSEVLSECLKNNKISKITLINRRKEIKNRKVKEIIHADFSDFSKIKKQINGHDICFYCVGVYTGGTSQQYFIKITYDYFKAFAKSVENKKTIFCLFSAQGADSKSKVMFAKWKGKCEDYLKTLKFKRTFIFRPGYIYPSNKAKRRTALFYRVLEFLFPILNIFLPWYCIDSKTLACGIVKSALREHSSHEYGNIDIRSI